MCKIYTAIKSRQDGPRGGAARDAPSLLWDSRSVWSNNGQSGYQWVDRWVSAAKCQQFPNNATIWQLLRDQVGHEVENVRLFCAMVVNKKIVVVWGTGVGDGSWPGGTSSTNACLFSIGPRPIAYKTILRHNGKWRRCCSSLPFNLLWYFLLVMQMDPSLNVAIDSAFRRFPPAPRIPRWKRVAQRLPKTLSS